MDTLTEIQARVLDAVRRHVDAGDPPPSYRDLCTEFGWSSSATARDHLHALERKGYINRPRHRGGRIKLRCWTATPASAPIVGRIVAGEPEPTDEHHDGRLPFPAEWAGSGHCFALRVAGDSMVNAGILENDHVIVRRQETARHGDIVAATINGETTLKRFVREGPRILLIAENPRYSAIKVTTESALIHGVVVGLLRAYRTPQPVPRARPMGLPAQTGERHAHRT